MDATSIYEFTLNGHPLYKSFKVETEHGEQLFPCSHDVKFLKLDGTFEEKNVNCNDIYGILKQYTKDEIPEHFEYYKDQLMSEALFPISDGY